MEYQKKQDPYLLRTWKYDFPGPSLIALSPDARTVALASGTTIKVYNVASSDCQEIIEDVHIGRQLQNSLLNHRDHFERLNLYVHYSSQVLYFWFNGSRYSKVTLNRLKLSLRVELSFSRW